MNNIFKQAQTKSPRASSPWMRSELHSNQSAAEVAQRALTACARGAGK